MQDKGDIVRRPNLPPLDAVYPHWLDPEYSSVNGLLNKSTRSVIHKSIYEVPFKLSILLGDKIVINDMQAWDGFIIPNCFADLGFVEFMQDHPDLLGMSISHDLSPHPDFDFLCASSGATRCLEACWSSTRWPKNSRLIQDLAEVLKKRKRDCLSPEWINSYVREKKDLTKGQCSYLISIHRAVCHFAAKGHPNAFGSPTASISYYQAAKELASSKLEQDGAKAIKELISFVESFDDDEIRLKRSALKEVLQKSWNIYDPLTDRGQAKLWSTAVHCYNRAVQNSLGVGIGSAGAVKGAPMVCSMPREIKSLVAACDEVESATNLEISSRLLLTGMPWELVRGIYNSTGDSRRAYRKSVDDGNTLEALGAKEYHLIKLAEAQAKLYGGDWKPAPKSELLFAGFEVGFHLLAHSQAIGPSAEVLTALTFLLPFVPPVCDYAVDLGTSYKRAKLQVAFQNFNMNVAGTLERL